MWLAHMWKGNLYLYYSTVYFKIVIINMCSRYRRSWKGNMRSGYGWTKAEQRCTYLHPATNSSRTCWSLSSAFDLGLLKSFSTSSSPFSCCDQKQTILKIRLSYLKATDILFCSLNIYVFSYISSIFSIKLLYRSLWK